MSNDKAQGRAIAIILFFPVVFLCSSAQTKDTTGSVQQIISVLTVQMQAWNNGDIEGYMNGYWKSDSLLFTSGGNIQRGWNATIAKYKASYSTKSKMGTLKFSDIQVSLLSDSSAWVFGRWELARESDHPEGVFTLIFRKFTEGWRIIHDHTSLKAEKK